MSPNDFSHRNTLYLGLLAACVSPAPGWAQDGAGADLESLSSSPGMIEEVMVTATRRETSVQSTPIAITAVGGDTLERVEATSVVDYAKFVPGLRVQDGGPGSRRMSLRGVNAAGEATVGIYYDETPISGTVGVSSDAGGRPPDVAAFDIERIEALRGPQGTLYGAGSMGGAIRLIFNKPEFEYEGKLHTSFSSTEGGGDNYTVNGMANLPLVDGLLAARLVAFRQSSDGYIDNEYLGIDDINSADKEGGRLMLRFTPTDTLTIDATGLIDRTDAHSNDWHPQYGEYVTVAQIVQPFEEDAKLYSLTVDWDLDFATLTASSAYYERATTYNNDDSYYIERYLDSETYCETRYNGGVPCSDEVMAEYNDYVDSEIPAVLQHDGEMTNTTHEIRLTSNSTGDFDWTVGAFLQDREDNVNSQDGPADEETGEIIYPMELFYKRYIIDELEQTAVFGETTWRATDRLSLTAGARWYEYEKTITGATTIPWELIGAGLKPRQSVSTKEDDVLYKLNAAYEFSDDMMGYVSAGEGFRPGGANQVIGLPDALTSYGADSLWNYEVGLKTSWLERRLFANAALYQIDWDNMQVRGRTLDGAFSFLSNAGAAQILGGELDMQFLLSEGWTLGMNAAYIDAQLTEDQVSGAVTAPGKDGDRLPYIPEFSAAVSAEYSWFLGKNYEASVRVDANYVGSSYSELRPDNPYRMEIEDYTLVNLRADIIGPSGWSAGFFANNLFDEVAINMGSKRSYEPYEIVTSSRPLTIGVSVSKEF